MDNAHELEDAPGFLVKIAFINTLNWTQKASGTLQLSQRVQKFKETIENLDEEAVKEFLVKWNDEPPQESLFTKIKDFYRQNVNTDGFSINI